jgi:hypothetical protein
MADEMADRRWSIPGAARAVAGRCQAPACGKARRVRAKQRLRHVAKVYDTVVADTDGKDPAHDLPRAHPVKPSPATGAASQAPVTAPNRLEPGRTGYEAK